MKSKCRGYGRKAGDGEYLEKYQRDKHEDRRSHLIDAAFSAFIERGYAKMKMADIARVAGYGKSTLYEYFDSKNEIMAELLRVKFLSRYKIIADSADAKGSPEESIRTFLGEEMDLILEYGANERLVTMMMTRPEEMISGILAEAGHTIILLKHEHIRGYIRVGIDEGLFRDTDPFIAASLVIGAASSYLGTVTSPEYKAYAAGTGVTDEDRRRAFFFSPADKHGAFQSLPQCQSACRCDRSCPPQDISQCLPESRSRSLPRWGCLLPFPCRARVCVSSRQARPSQASVRP
jgi:TetR/AcrR family fatty acid metabolism transcriptional regulator